MNLDASTPTPRDLAAPPAAATSPPALADRIANPPAADSYPTAYSNPTLSRLLSLPPELVLDIANFLPVRALFRLHLSCRHLHTLVLRLLTAAFSEQLDYVLSWSIEYNTPYIFTRALAAGAVFSPMAMTRIITLRHAALIPALFAVRPDYVNTANTADRHHPLHHAASEKAKTCLVALLHAGVLPNMQDANGSTALHKAVWANSESCVVALLHAGVLPNLQNADGSTALHTAIWVNSESCVGALLAAGAQPDLLNREGSTALHIAVWRDETGGCVRALLRGGALPDFRDASGHTPLHRAAAYNMESSVRALMEAGARPELPDGDGYMPLYHAFRGSREGVARVLIASGAGRMMALPAAVRKVGLGEESSGGDAAMYAVSHNPQMLAVVAEAGWVRPSVPGAVTPLQMAVRDGKLSVVRALLELGADVDELGENGWAPLHECVFQEEREEIMDLLIEMGAKTDTVGGVCVGVIGPQAVPGGGKGLTPLQLAREVGTRATVAKLEAYQTMG